MKNASQVSDKAQRLIDCGATFEKKEDNEGRTRSGWWMDTVFLGKTEQQAIEALG
jgi:hypothetical protein